MFAKSFIALLAATAVYAAPAPKVARDDLQPWEITRLFTHSPSGRPGNNPHSTINFTIEDPNIPTTGTCSLEFLTANDFPWGIEHACTTDDDTKASSTWTFTPTKPQSGSGYPTENFDLTIKLVNQVANATKTFTGGDHFAVGDNMSGQCGGSGVCNWNLKDTPYAVQQSEADA